MCSIPCLCPGLSHRSVTFTSRRGTGRQAEPLPLTGPVNKVTGTFTCYTHGTELHQETQSSQSTALLRESPRICSSPYVSRALDKLLEQTSMARHEMESSSFQLEQVLVGKYRNIVTSKCDDYHEFPEDQMSDSKPLDLLKAAVKNKTAVLLLGGGISASATQGDPRSTWRGLICSGIEYLKSLDSDGSALLELQLERANDADALITITQQLKNSLGSHYDRWLSNSIRGLEVKDPTLIKALGDLNLPILTTNYDTLVEEVLGLPSVAMDQPDEVRRVIRRESTGVIHLHGVVSRPETIVLNNEDYTVLQQESRSQDLQKATFQLSSFIFIGAGNGTDDPNFSPMFTRFASDYKYTSGAHFRLVRASEVASNSIDGSLETIVYGEGFDQLAPFLEQLKDPADASITINVRDRSIANNLDDLRETSLLWSENDDLGSLEFEQLIIPPIFMREPHEAAITHGAEEATHELIVDITKELQDPCTIVIAGDESAGVSTAIRYAAQVALKYAPGSFLLTIDDPLRSGPNPVQSQVTKQFRNWGLPTEDDVTESSLILSIDNLKYMERPRSNRSSQFQKAVDDILRSTARTKIIGVNQQDAVQVGAALTSESAPPVKVFYLGRFSSNEVRAAARMLVPEEQCDSVTSQVMHIVRENHLARTPFNIILLTSLAANSALKSDYRSETDFLYDYLKLILEFERFGILDTGSITLQNKEYMLQELAAKLILAKQEEIDKPSLLAWLYEEIEQVGWSIDPEKLVNDLVYRRVLSESGGKIQFRRSVYFEFYVGKFIKDSNSAKLKRELLTNPLRFSRFIRTYTALTRNDEEVLSAIRDLLKASLEKVDKAETYTFANPRKLVVDEPLFEDDPIDEVDSREGASELVYDTREDSDVPPYLHLGSENVDDPERFSILVDLASRVLRDSDQIRNQELKKETLELVLASWTVFIAHFEQQMTWAEGFEEFVTKFTEQKSEDSESEESVRGFLLTVLPSVVAYGGIATCLASTSLIKLISSLEVTIKDGTSYIPLMQVIALESSGSPSWPQLLPLLGEELLNTRFASTFLLGLAEYTLVSSRSLKPQDENLLWDFLKKILDVRYRFNSHAERVVSFNNYKLLIQRRARSNQRDPKQLNP